MDRSASGGCGRAFWSLVKREGRVVTVSKAELVDGGLSPPPSKIYPGTKCYMVIVAVDGKEYCGFGPSPSIAQRAAILEAYRCLSSCRNGVVLNSSKCLAEEEGSDSEEETIMSEATHPSHKEAWSPHPKVHCRKDAERCPPHYRAAQDADSVLNALLAVAQRKAVDIRFDFLYMTTEVVAVVFGGGLSFVGKHQEKLLAGREAALKMLEILEEWPDSNSFQAQSRIIDGQFQNSPPILPLVPVPPPPLPWSLYQPHLPMPPYRGIMPPPPLTSPQNGFRPPPLPFPFPPHSPGLPSRASTPLFHLPPDRSPRPRHFRPHPPQVHLHGDRGSSSEDDDGDTQQLSHGLCEVVPPQCDRRHWKEKDKKWTRSNSKQKNPVGNHLPLSYISPFESSYPISDPFQFTVRLPRTKNSTHSASERPPWKNLCSMDASSPPRPAQKAAWRSGVRRGNSKRGKVKNMCSPKEEQKVTVPVSIVNGKPDEIKAPVAKSLSVNSFPAHFLLPVTESLKMKPTHLPITETHLPVTESLEMKPTHLPIAETHLQVAESLEMKPTHSPSTDSLKSESSIAGSLEMKSLPAHFILPVAGPHPDTKPIPVHFLLQECKIENESLPSLRNHGSFSSAAQQQVTDCKKAGLPPLSKGLSDHSKRLPPLSNGLPPLSKESIPVSCDGGSFRFARAQERVSRMVAGEVCIGLPTEGPCST